MEHVVSIFINFIEFDLSSLNVNAISVFSRTDPIHIICFEGGKGSVMGYSTTGRGGNLFSRHQAFF